MNNLSTVTWSTRKRPEIVAWDFDQYVRILAAAKAESEEWYAGTCLAGEAGLRVGEIKALRWREDVDMVAKTITINFQTRNKETTTPKGRTRRTIPMTARLLDALKRAGSTDPEKIRAALAATDIPPEQLIVPYRGVKFDATGQNTLVRPILMQVQKGNYCTIHPFELASCEAVYPMPGWADKAKM